MEDFSKSWMSRNFFSMGFVKDIKFKDLLCDSREECSWQIQRDILRDTVQHPQCRKFPPALKYRISFLKALIKQLEMMNIDIVDEVYEEYTALLSQPAESTELSYKTYILPNGDFVAGKESTNLVSQGSTGLHTWQAALYLADWALEHSKVFNNRAVLELGSGIGLLGLVMCKVCRPSSYIFTDFHPDVIALLKDNIALNSHVSADCYLQKRSNEEHCHGGAGITNTPEHHDSNPIVEDGELRATYNELNSFREIRTIHALDTDDKDILRLKSCDNVKCDSEINMSLDVTDQQPQSSLSSQHKHSDSAKSAHKSTCCSGNRNYNHEEHSAGMSKCNGCSGSCLDVIKNCSATEIPTPRDCVCEKTETLPSVCSTCQQGRSPDVMELDWDKVSEDRLRQLASSTDVIVAADVVYDISIVTSLVRVLRTLLNTNKPDQSRPVAFIASTIRNPDTRSAFLKALEDANVTYESTEGPRQQWFIYDRTVPIELLKLRVK